MHNNVGFAKFASRTLSEVSAPSPRVHIPDLAEVRDSQSVWARISHGANLIGYSIHCSFAVLLYLIYLGSLSWETLPAEGAASVLEGRTVLPAIFLPFVLCFTFVRPAKIVALRSFILL